MRARALPVKVLWWLSIRCLSAILFCFYKLLPGVYFRSLGWGTRFYGIVSFGNVGADISLGRDCSVGRDVYLSASEGARLSLGDRSSVNRGCNVVAKYGIEIGDDVMIGEYVSIRDQDHVFDDPCVPINQQGFRGSPIRIGNDVWIGRGTFVGAGVTIGDGCVIGANSVVTRSLPPMSVAAGVPATVLRSRGKEAADEVTRP
jgi:acetyltransferase-like isoleucine patch superfamily enzyme